jgi:diadenylate cyclase
MKSLFTKDIGWKLVSLAAAVLLWIAVASEPELSMFISAPVQFKNLPQDLSLNSDIPESVYLEVRGPSGELRSVPESRRRYAVVFDMSDVGPGQRTFTIDTNDVRLPRGIQLVSAIPSQIRMNFEPDVTRSVPVKVSFAPGLPPDLKVDEANAHPDALTISGPASRVRRIDSVETDAVELKPDAGESEYRVTAYVPDPRVRIEGSPRVTVTVTVGTK